MTSNNTVKKREQKNQKNLFGDKIIDSDIKQEIRTGFLSYAVSVITDRAVPDVRDGLKPVQRRVLYAMYDLGITHDLPFKKSARIVGEAMGKYHPHGDSAIYGTMARMAQDYTMGVCLVDGQGNFGSIDGDSPAAMRYTEARLSLAGESMMSEINEDTIDFVPNFDGSLQEPSILPAMIPNLLVNGASGIAVGMSTNMPPYNLGEVAEACIRRIEKPESGVEDIAQIVPGPDFPTGGILMNTPEEILEIYRTGRGKLTIRSKYMVEKGRNGRQNIAVTEIPYAVNKTSMIESIIRYAKDNDGIDDIRDESDSKGIRVVIELSKDTEPTDIMKRLFAKTQLESSFSVVNLALYKGQAKEYSMTELLDVFIDFRRDIVSRRTKYRLKKAEARLHIVEGFLKALDVMDKIIKLIRSSSSAADAKSGLTGKMGFSDIQADAVLNMQLQRLTGLERKKLETEQSQLTKTIESLKKILGSSKVLDKVIKQELEDIKVRFGRQRRTKIAG